MRTREPFGITAHFREPMVCVVLYWINDGNEASACEWELPGTNQEDYN